MVKRSWMLRRAIVLVGVSTMSAHPLHTSFTEITRDARTGEVSISVRLFADDFGSTLDSIAAVGKVERSIAAQRYFERSVSLSTSDGKAIPLNWFGLRTADGLTWLCARTGGLVPAGRLRFRNTLMFDRFADQISIVRSTSEARVRTLVLSQRSSSAALD